MSLEFLKIGIFWREIKLLRILKAVVWFLIQVMRINKIYAFRAHTALKAYYYLLPESDVLKKSKQNHLLSTAIKAKFTFYCNRLFYFALPHICLFNINYNLLVVMV